VWTVIKNYLSFADPVVGQICATNWGDGVGITEEQAASVTDIGEIFRGNTQITSFNELERFGVKRLHRELSGTTNAAFEGCVRLKSVRVRDDFTYFGYDCFKDCTMLESINIPESTEYIEAGAFRNTKISGDIVVDKLLRIGESAFEGTNITSFSTLSTIPANHTLKGLADCPQLVSISAPNVTSIAKLQNTPKLIHIGDTSKWERIN
jgi:hypothetical protein